MSEFSFAILVVNVFRCLGTAVQGPKQVVGDFFSFFSPAYTLLQDLEKRLALVKDQLQSQFRGLWKNECDLLRALNSPADPLEGSSVGQIYGSVCSCAVLGCSSPRDWNRMELLMLTSLFYFQNTDSQKTDSELDEKLAQLMAKTHGEDIKFCRAVIAEIRVQITNTFCP